jgi:hypothetical protein
MSTTASEAEAAPWRRRLDGLLSLLRFPRRETGDFVDVGPIDADVAEFTVGIARKFLDRIPVDAARAQESREKQQDHGGLLTFDRPPYEIPNRTEIVGAPLFLNRVLDGMVQRKSQWCGAINHVNFA